MLLIMLDRQMTQGFQEKLGDYRETRILLNRSARMTMTRQQMQKWHKPRLHVADAQITYMNRREEGGIEGHSMLPMHN